MKVLLFGIATLTSALRLPAPATQQQSRRGLLINSAGALASFASLAVAPPVQALGPPGVLSKEELAARIQERREEEKIAALPINKLKAIRATIADAPALLDAADWAGVRTTIGLAGPSFSKLIKSSGFSDAVTLQALKLTVQLRKDLLPADTFAYNEQVSPTLCRAD